MTLTEQQVQPALLRGVAAQDDDGDEAESEAGLPHLQVIFNLVIGL